MAKLSTSPITPLIPLRHGRPYMVSLVKIAAPDKCLLNRNDEWNRKKVLEYLDNQKRFIELLMLLMLLIGGQPARGPELGSVKFRNSTLSRCNFFIIDGHGFYVTEYHKTKASTNYSYFVVRYLPQPVTRLILLLYIAFIQPFCKLLYNQVSITKNSIDDHHLFCHDSNSDICWNGKRLSEVLQRESHARIDVKINLWAYRHIAISITKAHVKDIAPHFSKDDVAWKQILERDPNFNVFAWQAGHKRAMNISTYGLDQTYSCQLQPELLHEYLRISLIWHRLLGFVDDNMSDSRMYIDRGIPVSLMHKGEMGVNQKRREEGQSSSEDASQRENEDDRGGDIDDAENS